MNNVTVNKSVMIGRLGETRPGIAAYFLRHLMADEVTVSKEDFAQLVQGDWNWKRQFLRFTRAYSASAARELEASGDE